MKALVLIWTVLAIAGAVIEARSETPVERGEYLVTVVMGARIATRREPQTGS